MFCNKILPLHCLGPVYNTTDLGGGFIYLPICCVAVHYYNILKKNDIHLLAGTSLLQEESLHLKWKKHL